MKIFRHSGKLGDAIFSLPAIRFAGGGILYLDPQHFSWVDAERLKPLLLKQPYIFHCHVGKAPSIDFDLDAFREFPPGAPLTHVDRYMELVEGPQGGPWPMWLENIARNPATAGKVIFSRSSRYAGYDGFWAEAYKRFSEKAVFVGLPEDHALFQSEVGPVRHFETNDMLELAMAIEGAALFVGRVGAPHSIAEGLKVKAIVDVSRFEPPEEFNREGLYCVYSHEDWDKIPL